MVMADLHSKGDAIFKTPKRAAVFQAGTVAHNRDSRTLPLVRVLERAHAFVIV
jgi:hypothetical protein